MTISTYSGYKLYASNYQKSLLRTAAEPTVAADQSYYQANIGKVKSVDDFLNNNRLFTFAMKAYGLDDLGNAKGLMKKVLESDLTDSTSFARRVTDKRYLAFAKAYSFLSNGSIATSAPIQTAGQRADLLQKAGLDADTAARFGAQIDAIKSVADLESNASVYGEILLAYGLDAKTTLKSDVTAALESNLSDPGSTANRTGNEKLLALAKDFNFTAKGAIGSQRLLQSPGNIARTETAYLATVGTSTDAQAAAQTETAYYDKTIPKLTSVDQILADPRLVSYVKTAFGLDAATSTTTLRAVLTSNSLDPKSVANTYGVDPTAATSTTPTNYQIFASAFNVGTDGAAWDHGAVASAASVTAAIAAYTTAAKADKTEQATQDTTVADFASAVASSKSATDLLSQSDVVTFLQKAYGLPNATAADLENYLTSNLLDPTSAASQAGGAARTLAAAFNFAPSGLVYAQRPIMSAANLTATTTAYTAQAKTDAGSKAAAQAETDYFTTSIAKVKSLDDLLADKRLVAYIETANGIPASTLTSKLRQALTSNLASAKSVANTLGGGFVTAAASLDIASDGSIAAVPTNQAQSRSAVIATTRAYLEEQMESEANTSNPGVKLALYFRSKASTITSAYDILSDKALTKVVQTILGLTSDSSKADIDSQARTITSNIKLTDLKDPAKLEKLIARFATLYDLQNNQGNDPLIAQLFGGGDDTSSS